jgi:hypothetical protein
MPASAAKRNENFLQPYALLEAPFLAPSSSASRLTLFDNHWTVTAIGAEGMPLATTTSWLGPNSWFAGTSKHGVLKINGLAIYQNVAVGLQRSRSVGNVQ